MTPAEYFDYIRNDPWEAAMLPLPKDGGTLEDWRDARTIIYVLLQAVDYTLDESLVLIGKLVEIDWWLGSPVIQEAAK